MNLKCEVCRKDVSPDKCYIRVTGWGKPSKTGKVTELIGASAPHGFMCDSCGFDLKHGAKPATESLF